MAGKAFNVEWKIVMIQSDSSSLHTVFSMNDYYFFVVNRTKGQMLLFEGGCSGIESVNFGAVRTVKCRSDLRLYDQKGKQLEVNPEWIRDAKLYVIHAKRLGSFSRSFQFGLGETWSSDEKQ